MGSAAESCLAIGASLKQVGARSKPEWLPHEVESAPARPDIRCDLQKEISMRTRFALLLTALTLILIVPGGSVGAPQATQLQPFDPWLGAWQGSGSNSGVAA